MPDRWQQLYEQAQTAANVPTETEIFAPDAALVPEERHEGSNIIADKSPAHYQYKGCYIMTAVKSGLMIIDQHRADLRIRYERYLSRMQSEQSGCQRVLFPEVVQFPPSDSVILTKILPELARLGFDLTDLGGCSYAINGTPAGLEGLDIIALLQSMVSDAVEKGSASLDDIRRTIALSMARSAAIPEGQILSNDEMENVINELFTCSNVNYTPDGKPIIHILPQDEIERRMN